MKKRLPTEAIAARVVKEFNDGDYVNLGVGIPALCVSFIPPERIIFMHAEDGMLGYGKQVQDYEKEKASTAFVDGGCNLVHYKPGMSCFDIGLSFDIILGKHLDYSVMGALEVSEKGDLANWTRSGIELAGVGGSVDLAVGAKKVIICMEHTTRKGIPRIVKQCKFPLTALKCVSKIFTDIAVIDVIDHAALLLREYAPGWTVEEIQSLTEPKLLIAADLKVIESL